MRKLKIKRRRKLIVASAALAVLLVIALIAFPKEKEDRTAEGVALLKKLEKQDVSKIETEISALDKISGENTKETKDKKNAVDE